MTWAGGGLSRCRTGMRARLELRGSSGFTLMEVLTVMVILGILVAIAVPVLHETRERARRTRAAAEIRVLAGQLRAVLDTANSPTTIGLTGNVWTSGPCVSPGGRVLYELPETDSCWVTYRQTLEVLRVKGAVDIAGFTQGDPWGSPFLIDENEGERHSGLCYRRDSVHSAGRNGISEGGAGDDIMFSLPRRKSTSDC